MNYQTFKIDSSFHLDVVDSRKELMLSDIDDARVNHLWKVAQKRHDGRLFDGKLLNYVTYNPMENQLVGRFIQYRYYIAQLYDPALKPILNISPISMSCICSQNNLILVGKRSSFVTDCPNLYELVPSGGIDPVNVHQGRVNIIAQAKTELFEEAGIYEDLVTTCRAIALIHDLNSGLHEICLRIELEDTGEIGLKKSGEYSELMWMSRKQLEDFIAKEKEAFVPFSLFLLERIF